jgi:endonuclease/exonuclease/phosphatase family metal-dependent hydrolase
MTTTLHCLAYNAHLFVDTAVELSAKQVYNDTIRINGIITQIQNLKPDIVSLSEVWANNSKEEFTERLKEELPYSAWDDNKKILQIGSGLLLLSRFPLSHISFTKYTSLVGSDSLSQKGFIIATVEVGGQKLLIACTHVQADDNSAAIEARKSNISQLKNGISNAAGVSTPVILLGDLNIIGENQSGTPTDEYKSLCDTLKSLQMSDSYPTLHPDATSAPGYTYDAVNNKLIARFAPSDANNKVRERLDYIFVRGITPTSVTVLDSFTFQPPDETAEWDLSDHYPLDGKFSIQ